MFNCRFPKFSEGVIVYNGWNSMSFMRIWRDSALTASSILFGSRSGAKYAPKQYSDYSDSSNAPATPPEIAAVFVPDEDESGGSAGTVTGPAVCVAGEDAEADDIVDIDNVDSAGCEAAIYKNRPWIHARLKGNTHFFQ